MFDFWSILTMEVVVSSPHSLQPKVWTEFGVRPCQLNAFWPGAGYYHTTVYYSTDKKICTMFFFLLQDPTTPSAYPPSFLPLSLTFSHITYRINAHVEQSSSGSNTILNDISGRVESGSFLAIMGPSGTIHTAN